MKIFLSYGHDSNAPLIEEIRDYLSVDSNGNPRHDVWIDSSEIKAGDNWRNRITRGVLDSDIVLAGLSEHSTRNPGVCRDELNISIGVKGGNIQTILLEPSDVVAPPAMLSHIQWLDMSDWKEHEKDGFDSDYFQSKFKQLLNIIETPENEKFNGEITKLKQRLEPISSIARIRQLTKKEMYGRKWLYDKIVEWDKTSDQQIFWIMAGPGFGKSMFAANLQANYNANIPAVQFVEWGKPDHSNPCRILKNLAFQLAVRYPEYRTFILSLPDVVNDKLMEKNEDELFDLLFCESTWMKIDGGQENVWVLIDALDEADDEYGNRIAQTIARHIERLPHWLRFILTSRDDSKVRLPLQKYHPQVFDLEEYVKTMNSQDLFLYVRGELGSIHPTEAQVQQIVEKSQGVFLYLSLCVEGILKGQYSLDALDKLPDGLNGYYYEFFMRQFGDDIGYFKEKILRILQIMAVTKSPISVSLLRYCAGIESETEFYEILGKLEHICRFSYEKTIRKVGFFHNSIENWLTNRMSSGSFYVSKEDGYRLLGKRWANWVISKDASIDSFWEDYGDGIKLLLRLDYAMIVCINPCRLLVLLNTIDNVGQLSFYIRSNNCEKNADLVILIDYLEGLLFNGQEQHLTTFIDILFEAIKEGLINIGFASRETRMFEFPDSTAAPNSIHRVICYTALMGAVGKDLYMSRSKTPVSNETLSKIAGYINILSFYDRRIGEYLISEIGSLSDYADFTAHALDRIEEIISSE